MAGGAISIRHCHSLEDFDQCVNVQKAVWGWADADLIPLRFFVVASKIEGQVIGAFEESGRMAGFCLAVPALRGRMLYLHSHMLAVMRGFRQSGLGRQLKLEQRRDALQRGIRLVEWTFDPLEWKNASFNLNRLGAIARRYVPNQYGLSSSPLHRGLPTDRLVAEWWLDSPRVAALASQAGDAPAAESSGPEAASETTFPEAAASEMAAESEAPASANMQRIELPLNLTHELRESPSVAEVQLTLRQAFQEALAAGLAAVEFQIHATRGSYLLTPWTQTE